MNTKVVALLVFFGALLAATFIYTPVAQAEPSTVAGVAGHVCSEISINPTPDTVSRIVVELFAAGNTEEQENQVMWYAMNKICPQYKPLAIQAALNLINRANTV